MVRVAKGLDLVDAICGVHLQWELQLIHFPSSSLPTDESPHLHHCPSPRRSPAKTSIHAIVRDARSSWSRSVRVSSPNRRANHNPSSIIDNEDLFVYSRLSAELMYDGTTATRVGIVQVRGPRDLRHPAGWTERRDWFETSRQWICVFSRLNRFEVSGLTCTLRLRQVNTIERIVTTKQSSSSSSSSPLLSTDPFVTFTKTTAIRLVASWNSPGQADTNGKCTHQGETSPIARGVTRLPNWHRSTRAECLRLKGLPTTPMHLLSASEEPGLAKTIEAFREFFQPTIKNLMNSKMSNSMSIPGFHKTNRSWFTIAIDVVNSLVYFRNSPWTIRRCRTCSWFSNQKDEYAISY